MSIAIAVVVTAIVAALLMAAVFYLWSDAPVGEALLVAFCIVGALTVPAALVNGLWFLWGWAL